MAGWACWRKVVIPHARACMTRMCADGLVSGSAGCRVTHGITACLTNDCRSRHPLPPRRAGARSTRYRAWPGAYKPPPFELSGSRRISPEPSPALGARPDTCSDIYTYNLATAKTMGRTPGSFRLSPGAGGVGTVRGLTPGWAGSSHHLSSCKLYCMTRFGVR